MPKGQGVRTFPMRDKPLIRSTLHRIMETDPGIRPVELRAILRRRTGYHLSESTVGKWRRDWLEAHRAAVAAMAADPMELDPQAGPMITKGPVPQAKTSGPVPQAKTSGPMPYASEMERMGHALHEARIQALEARLASIAPPQSAGWDFKLGRMRLVVSQRAAVLTVAPKKESQPCA